MKKAENNEWQAPKRKPYLKGRFIPILKISDPNQLEEDRRVSGRETEIAEFDKELEKLMRRYWVWTIYAQIVPEPSKNEILENSKINRNL
jgi:hypothetical protein